MMIHHLIVESFAQQLAAKEVENFNDAFLALDQDNSGEMEAEGCSYLFSFCNCFHVLLSSLFFLAELAVVLQVLGLPGGVQEVTFHMIFNISVITIQHLQECEIQQYKVKLNGNK